MNDKKPKPMESRTPDEQAAFIVGMCLSQSDIEIPNGTGRWKRKAIHLRQRIAAAIQKAYEKGRFDVLTEKK